MKSDGGNKHRSHTRATRNRHRGTPLIDPGRPNLITQSLVPSRVSKSRMNQVSHRPDPAQSHVMSVITEAVRGVSAKARDVEISPETSLIEDLALDSLDLVAVVLQLQDHFQIEIDPDDLPTLRSVGDLITSLDKHRRAAA